VGNNFSKRLIWFRKIRQNLKEKSIVVMSNSAKVYINFVDLLGLWKRELKNVGIKWYVFILMWVEHSTIQRIIGNLNLGLPFWLDKWQLCCCEFKSEREIKYEIQVWNWILEIQVHTKMLSCCCFVTFCCWCCKFVSVVVSLVVCFRFCVCCRLNIIIICKEFVFLHKSIDRYEQQKQNKKYVQTPSISGRKKKILGFTAILKKWNHLKKKTKGWCVCYLN
jgi:hypothetical protein